MGRGGIFQGGSSLGYIFSDRGRVKRPVQNTKIIIIDSTMITLTDVINIEYHPYFIFPPQICQNTKPQEKGNFKKKLRSIRGAVINPGKLDNLNWR